MILAFNGVTILCTSLYKDDNIANPWDCNWHMILETAVSLREVERHDGEILGSCEDLTNQTE